MLGAVGDVEEHIKQTSFYSILDRFMHDHGVTFNELQDMVACIDANYKIGDKHAVEQAVSDLAHSNDIPSFIKKNSAWNNAKNTIDKEIGKALAGDDEYKGRIRIKYMNSHYNIISTVTRRIWDKKNPVIVVNKGFFPEDYQIYARADDCLSLIDMAVARGYIAGGKKNVMGAIVPRDHVDIMVTDIVAMLGGRE